MKPTYSSISLQRIKTLSQALSTQVITLNRILVPLTLAMSITMSSMPVSYAGPGDVNSVNNGQVVQGGTYYNTPGNNTTFVNTGGGGLWVQKNTTVRGLESDLAGNPTGNGGWLHFSAPGSVVRVDGNINVNALMGKSGSFLGNGGRVTIDSAYLYQNGNIFANGASGGLVQFNVGSAMFGPNATIEAKGFGDGFGGEGHGGQISINSPGVVDIRRGAILDASGRVIGTYDRTLINIEGGLINVEGVLRADGTVIDGEGSNGGTIRLIATGMSDVDCVDCAVTKVTNAEIVDKSINTGGETYETVSSDLEDSGKIFTAEDRDRILDRQNNLVDEMDGSITIGEYRTKGKPGGVVSANGTNGNSETIDGHNGGSIILSALNDIQNQGQVTANGGHGAVDTESYAAGNAGHGGTIAFSAGQDIVNELLIQANGGNGASNAANSIELENADNGDEIGGGDTETVADASHRDGGNGGNAGVIAFSYGDDMTNNGTVEANGGAGGDGANASATDTEIGHEGSGVHNTQATALAGDGGHGGNGGLIVFAGDSNPTGEGFVNANGGDSGLGGNATAHAEASNNTDSSGQSVATAVAGNGGAMGDAGLIVSEDPDALPSDQTISSNSGRVSTSGTATAMAIADHQKGATANATAETGFNGTSYTFKVKLKESVSFY